MIRDIMPYDQIRMASPITHVRLKELGKGHSAPAGCSSCAESRIGCRGSYRR
jgi:hypothetical protein